MVLQRRRLKQLDARQRRCWIRLHRTKVRLVRGRCRITAHRSATEPEPGNNVEAYALQAHTRQSLGNIVTEEHCVERKLRPSSMGHAHGIVLHSVDNALCGKHLRPETAAFVLVVGVRQRAARQLNHDGRVRALLESSLPWTGSH